MPGPINTTVGGDDEPPVDTEPPQRLSVDIVHESGDWSLLGDVDAAVQAAVQAVATCPGLTFEPASVCIALASDATVRALNRDYRGLDKPTNVLSFPIAASVSDASQHLGDVVLAVETVVAEASAAGVNPTHHVQHLVVHGTLHLLGYEHESSRQATHMERLEIAILGQLGVADPYREDAT